MLDYLKNQTPHLNFDLIDGILTISILRPKAKNALNSEMYTQLAQAFIDADEATDIHVIILRGNETDFTAGNDMSYFLSLAQTQATTLDEDIFPPFHFLKALAQCSKPIIAAIRGCTIGVGVTLLFHCDLVFAEDNAIFQLPFVNLGLSVEGATSLFMTPQAGYHLAAELLLTGEKFNAEKALTARLINQIVPDAYTYAHQQAQKMGQLSLTSLRIIKKQIKFPIEQILQCIDQEAEIVATRIKSAETLAAVSSFLQTRSLEFPQFPKNYS
ncbi:hypothetical protein F895_03156 [Acinetobacter sp. CIP 64.2]|uniref:Enoyl-CoA hydratase n=2 Tax=Acinetobacter TaxID=469 RepID=A0A558EVB7_9GAMM|nr:MULTISPECIES: enoyl-CoA hydratase-related protein [Acinetobacter]ENX12229.1 hypothetical protein F895_03156 [Acinetobacter sp. CIP 64.2]TVT77345.1 enoyl-CoA hydratase [Acinetobacter colistiniresistens]